MPVPQQVLDAEAEADRLISTIAGAPPSGDAKDPVDETDPDARAAAGDGEDDGGETKPEGASDGKKPEGEPAAPAPDKAPEEVAALQSQVAELQAQLTKLQAAHDTLRGKTYAEVPRALAENKSLREKIAALEAENTSLKKGEAPAGVPAAKLTGKAADILTGLKEKVNDDVAEQIQLLAAAIAEESVSRAIKPMASDVETLRASNLTSRQNAYVRTLTERVPDWRTVANNPEYSDFLSQTDELSGKTLYDLASEALDSLDADRMARFFTRFKASKAGTAAAAGAGEGEEKPPAAGKEALLAPKGTAKTGKREVAEGEKPDYITTKQLEQFSKDRKKMDADEEAKMEARIDKAIQKGWIVPV